MSVLHLYFIIFFSFFFPWCHFFSLTWISDSLSLLFIYLFFRSPHKFFRYPYELHQPSSLLGTPLSIVITLVSILTPTPPVTLPLTPTPSSQATLAILDKLDVDTDKPTEEEIARKFGFEEDYLNHRVSWWQKTRPKIWSLFDEPYSSWMAKVRLKRE